MSSLFSNKYPIPDNFPQILHDYAKEIVRNRPKDILEFSIQYFYSLENNLKINSNDNNHTIDNKDNENSKQEPITANNDKIITGKEKANNQPNENQIKLLENNNLLNEKNDIFEKDEDTFSNISGTSDDKNGVKNFVGNIMEESIKCALMKEE